MFSLSKLQERIYLLNFDNRYDVAMTFLRYQEFYESDNLQFKGRAFTISEYMAWYTRNRGQQSFTYPTDWCGFNIPIKVIKEVQDLHISDVNSYDGLMAGVMGLINSESQDAYLIGTSKHQSEIIAHERAHGLFYTNHSYRDRAAEIISRASTVLINALCDKLGNMGYHSDVWHDEIQACSVCGQRLIEGDAASNSAHVRLMEEMGDLYQGFLPS